MQSQKCSAETTTDESDSDPSKTVSFDEYDPNTYEIAATLRHMSSVLSSDHDDGNDDLVSLVTTSPGPDTREKGLKLPLTTIKQAVFDRPAAAVAPVKIEPVPTGFQDLFADDDVHTLHNMAMQSTDMVCAHENRDQTVPYHEFIHTTNKAPERAIGMAAPFSQNTSAVVRHNQTRNPPHLVAYSNQPLATPIKPKSAQQSQNPIAASMCTLAQYLQMAPSPNIHYQPYNQLSPQGQLSGYQWYQQPQQLAPHMLHRQDYPTGRNSPGIYTSSHHPIHPQHPGNYVHVPVKPHVSSDVTLTGTMQRLPDSRGFTTHGTPSVHNRPRPTLPAATMTSTATSPMTTITTCPTPALTTTTATITTQLIQSVERTSVRKEGQKHADFSGTIFSTHTTPTLPCTTSHSFSSELEEAHAQSGIAFQTPTASMPCMSSREEDLAKKKIRTIYSPQQVGKLEKVFRENNYPGVDAIDILAKELDIPSVKIKVWFQNKRARMRRRLNDQTRALCASTMSSLGDQSRGMYPPNIPVMNDHARGMCSPPMPGVYPGMVASYGYPQRMMTPPPPPFNPYLAYTPTRPKQPNDKTSEQSQQSESPLAKMLSSPVEAQSPTNLPSPDQVVSPARVPSPESNQSELLKSSTQTSVANMTSSVMPAQGTQQSTAFVAPHFQNAMTMSPYMCPYFFGHY